jgi:hypothetical protein
MARLILIGVAVVIGVLVAIFTVDKKEVGSFNNRLVDDLAKMNAGFDDFDARIEPYRDGARADVAALRTAQQSLLTNTQGFLTKVKEMSVPDADSCRALHTAIVEYMDNSVKLADAYGEMVTYIETHNPGNDQDMAHIGSMFDNYYMIDADLLDAVVAKQEVMAKEFNIKLEN